MKLPFLASFIIFIIVLSHRIRYDRNHEEKIERSFWDREQAANQVRRKPLDSLEYITIPLEDFPTDVMADNETVAECIDQLRALSTLPIVNLTGYTNTDLKLEYGAPNLQLLSDYDQNYTILVRTLQRWADVLWEAGYRREASILMEFAVSTRTDVRETYLKLAKYWTDEGESGQVARLIETASSLRSSNRDILVKKLREQYPV